uniref:Uncharacterized protein n=1 Tax=Clytia hemisphaerica TaxID=252671 RepID=A0A7M5TQ71_9CNID
MERIDVNSNTVQTKHQYDEECLDECDGKSTKQQLGEVMRVCAMFAQQLQHKCKEYSEEHFVSFDSVDHTGSMAPPSETYESQWQFKFLFRLPANLSSFDALTDPIYLLAAKRIIYDVGRHFYNMAESTGDTMIREIMTALSNVLQPLEGVVPRLVNETSLQWQPREQKMADLEREADSVPAKDWPICKEAGLTRDEKRQKLINLTLIKHLEHLMTGLEHSARVLYNKH